MKTKSTAIAVLLICVGVIVLAQILGASRAKPAAPAASTNATPNPLPVARASHKVVAYYFHRTVRCETCRTIETQARATVDAEFTDAIKAGTLEWHTVNVEAAGNEPFVKDYDLTMPSLVLVDLLNGRRVRWTKLSRVWELVQSPPAFSEYVQDELRGYLGER